jgi:transposase
MGKGRRSAVVIQLTLRQHEALTEAVRHPDTANVARAQLVLLRAEGVPIAFIAHRVGIARRHVYKWLYRFLEAGLPGLDNRPRGKRRSRWDT